MNIHKDLIKLVVLSSIGGFLIGVATGIIIQMIYCFLKHKHLIGL